LGETLPSIARDMDTISFRIPLGVCAGMRSQTYSCFNFFNIFKLKQKYLIPNKA
jgi:hypothetical protein